MVSMKDISVACGVSVATVSKALNNHTDIGAETKLHIKQVAKEMGYFPNSSARALKTNRSYNIGVLFIDEVPQSGLTHDYFSFILDSFKTTVEKQGYDITFINCYKGKKNTMSYLEHSRYRGVDGVLIACVNFLDEEVQELIQSDIPVVVIDRLFPDKLAVISDNEKGMHDLLTYIYNLGHRKIAYIYGQKSAVTESRLKGFYDTAKELGVEIYEDFVLEGKYRDIPAASKRTAELLDRKDKPTCIIYPDDFAAIGGMNEIKARGLSIPKDISIAGYDGINIVARLEPQLTTVHQDTRVIGRVAAENLINLIEKPNSTAIEHVVIQGSLIEGKSVGNLG